MLTASAAERRPATHTKGYNELRNPYFGQTHQHTGWSFDEAIYNVRLGPDNAFRHARGEKVKHPGGYDVQLKVPLDFLAVSDHSEYLGVLLRMYDPNDPLSKHPLAQEITSSGNDVKKATKVFYKLVSETIQPDGSVKADPVLADPALKRTIWDQYIQIADSFNEPGKFTTLVGLRVVVAAEHVEPAPQRHLPLQQEPAGAVLVFRLAAARGTLEVDGCAAGEGHATARDSAQRQPEQRRHVCSHRFGRQADHACYAETRARNERLTEIVQTKGQSETNPGVAPNDEFAGFELWTKPVAGPGTVKVVEDQLRPQCLRATASPSRQRLGANPFKYGVVGGGDIHTVHRRRTRSSRSPASTT